MRDDMYSSSTVSPPLAAHGAREQFTVRSDCDGRPLDKKDKPHQG